MIIALSEGFESSTLLGVDNGSGTPVDNINSSVGLAISTTARSGSYGATIAGSGNVVFNVSNGFSSAGSSMAFYAISGTGNDGSVTLADITVAGSAYAAVRLNYSGSAYTPQFTIAGVSVTPTIYTVLPANLLSSQDWHQVCVIQKAKGNTRGLQLFIDGVSIASCYATSTPWAGATKMAIRPDVDVNIDDVVAGYSSGGEPYNLPNKIVRIEPMRPLVDVVAQFTRVGGTYDSNSDLLRVLPVSTSRYLSKSATAYDTYTTENYVPASGERGTIQILDSADRGWGGISELRSPLYLAYGFEIVYGVVSNQATFRSSIYWNNEEVSYRSYINSTTGMKALKTEMSASNFDRNIHGIIADEMQVKVSISSVTGEARIYSAYGYVIVVTALGSQSPYNGDGYDFEFDIPSNALASADLYLQTNIHAPNADSGECRLVLSQESGRVEIIVQTMASDEINIGSQRSIVFTELPVTSAYHFRIVFHGQFLSIYANHKWLHTFGFEVVTYPESFSMSARVSAGTLALTNFHVSELYDRREAIWIEYDQYADAAIGSIIQERPVEVSPSANGGIKIYSRPDYSAKYALSNIKSVAIDESDTKTGASDALVYYADVTVVEDNDYLENCGFSTKIMQLPSLESGARKAAKRLMHTARENEKRFGIGARGDLRVEAGDVISISDNVSGTLTPIVYDIIVESCDISFTSNDMDLSLRMDIAGRQYLSE